MTAVVLAAQGNIETGLVFNSDNIVGLRSAVSLELASPQRVPPGTDFIEKYGEENAGREYAEALRPRNHHALLIEGSFTPYETYTSERQAWSTGLAVGLRQHGYTYDESFVNHDSLDLAAGLSYNRSTTATDQATWPYDASERVHIDDGLTVYAQAGMKIYCGDPERTDVAHPFLGGTAAVGHSFFRDGFFLSIGLNTGIAF